MSLGFLFFVPLGFPVLSAIKLSEMIVLSPVSLGLNLNYSILFSRPLVAWPLWPFSPVTLALAFSDPVTANHLKFLPLLLFLPLSLGHDILSPGSVFPLLLHI